MARFFVTLWVKTANLNLLVYAGIVGMGYAWEYYRKNRFSRLEASQLEARLAEARLEALRNRLNPHFLFNTLHTILALVRKDPETAEGMLAGLSDLLRKALDTSDRQEVPLKDELDFLNLYLEIQKVRFRERLKIELSIDPRSLSVPVPNFILQPLVENAIQHGIAPRAEGGSLTISSDMEGHRLILRVRDSGPGFPEGDTDSPKKGFGLTNTRARLDLHYGPLHSLHLENSPEGGASVILELPVTEHRTEGLQP
jgi:LytS/YehU family sensor histidine kinase